MSTYANRVYTNVRNALKAARKQNMACLLLSGILDEESSDYAKHTDTREGMRAFLATFDAIKHDRFDAWDAYMEGTRRANLLSSLLS